MASSLFKCILLIPLVAMLACSIPVGARESMMFSRVSSGVTEKPENQQTASSTETSIPVSGETESRPFDSTGQAERDNSYGLYGNEGVSKGYEVLTKEDGKLTSRQGEGMSDTRSLEGGKYFYNVNAASEDVYRKDGASYGNSDRLEFQNSEVSFNTRSSNQNGEGLSDTRAMEGGKYYFDISGSGHGEAYSSFNDMQFPTKSTDEMEEGSKYAQTLTDVNYQTNNMDIAGEKAEDTQTEDKAKSYNEGENEERHVFDTIEEYEKYAASRPYKYKP